MGHYQINDLERLSGIRAHTIRIWEKRYAIIAPQRTQSNIRLYDDAQLKKLLNISLLVRFGQKISHIAALSEQELHDKVQEFSASPVVDEIAAIYIHKLILAMLAFDGTAFDKTYAAAVKRLGIYEAMMQVCYPFLHKTGVLWCVDEALPAQEHFASGLIRRKLMAAIDQLPHPVKKDKSFVLFLPSGEWHDIPLFFAEYLIRAAGHPVVNLGQHVPQKDLDLVLETVKPSHLLFFTLSAGDQHGAIARLQQQLVLKHPGILCLAGGRTDQLKNQETGHRISILEEPSAIFRFL